MGKRISSLRKQCGLTQDQLAARVGVTAQAVSKWENDISCPDISILAKLAETLGVTTDELLGVKPVDPRVVVVESDKKRSSGAKKQQSFTFRWDGGKRSAIFLGLLVALVITLSITSVAGSAQQMIISALYLDYIEWLKPAWRGIGLAISIFANYLLFFWIFWRLPRHRPRKKALMRGTLIAAIGFEVIKIVMTYTLPSLVKSPSGAAFGSVLGLMAFFYFFARLTLFCAAWIATAEYKDDPRMPGKTHR